MTPQFRNELAESSVQIEGWAVMFIGGLALVLLCCAVVSAWCAFSVQVKEPEISGVVEKGDVFLLNQIDGARRELALGKQANMNMGQGK